MTSMPPPSAHSAELPVRRFFRIEPRFGLAADGTASPDPSRQFDLAWASLARALGGRDLVRVTVQVTRGLSLDLARRIEQRVTAETAASWGFMVVPSLAHDGALLSLEGLAAQ